MGKKAAKGHPSIKFGKDGYWHGYLTVGTRDDGAPDRRHTMSTSRKNVEKNLDKLMEQMANGELERAGDRWTVEEWLTHWLETLSKPYVSENTYDGYRVAVNNHLIPRIGKHRLSSLKPDHIEKMYLDIRQLKTKRGTQMSVGRIQQIHRTLTTALNAAVARGKIKVNPTAIARLPREDEEFEVDPYTVEEVRRLFVAAGKERNGARWVLALSLGLRQGESLGLQWSDVSWETSTMRVRRNRLRPKYRHGCTEPCGRKYAGYCPKRVQTREDAGRTKSKAGKRIVPLPETLLAILNAHKTAQEAERKMAGSVWEDNDWMFASETGACLSPRTDWDRWKNLLKSANVRDGRLHDARHTAATVLFQLGTHERTLMDIMGWSTAAMAKRYTHVLPPVRDAVATQLDGYLWKAG